MAIWRRRQENVLNFHVKRPRFGFAEQIFIKVPNVRFYGNPSRWSRGDMCRQTDGHERFWWLCERTKKPLVWRSGLSLYSSSLFSAIKKILTNLFTHQTSAFTFFSREMNIRGPSSCPRLAQEIYLTLLRDRWHCYYYYYCCCCCCCCVLLGAVCTL